MEASRANGPETGISSTTRLETRMKPDSGGGRDLYLFRKAGGFGNWLSKVFESSDVPLDGFPDISLGFFQACTCRDTTGQIGNIGCPIVFSLLENYRVLPTHFSISRLAALRIDFSVPTGKSSPGWPGTVTTFGLD